MSENTNHWLARGIIEGVLSKLSPKEECVLKLRYGFHRHCCTYQEIADNMGFTKERGRQIENGALRRLRCYHHEPLRDALELLTEIPCL